MVPFATTLAKTNLVKCCKKWTVGTWRRRTIVLASGAPSGLAGSHMSTPESFARRQPSGPRQSPAALSCLRRRAAGARRPPWGCRPCAPALPYFFRIWDKKAGLYRLSLGSRKIFPTALKSGCRRGTSGGAGSRTGTRCPPRASNLILGLLIPSGYSGLKSSIASAMACLWATPWP
jgi:hypothetical protein